MKLFYIATTILYITIYVNASAPDCTITGTSISNIASVKASCTSIIVSNLVVPAGETLDLTGLKTGTTVTFQGSTTFGYKEWVGPLISVSGTSINIVGGTGSLIDGNGARWWDGQGGNGGKTKPKFFKASKLINSNIKSLNIKDTPVQCFSLNTVTNLHVTSVTIDNRNGAAKGHNTDAFDVGSSDGVHITDCTVYNQDDCLAINSGTNVYFQNSYCSGGHGISIGSVGGRDDNTVSGVYVSNCTIANSQNGVRVKTVYNASGSVKNVTYQDITLKDITKYGIVIEGDYENGSPTGVPTGGVPIVDLTLTNVKGSVASSGTNVYILVKNAASWKWSSISVTGGTVKAKCTGIPTGSGASCS